MDNERLTIGKAAVFLGVAVQTLRRWDASGRLPAERSRGGHRYYRLDDLRHFRTDLAVLGKAWAMSVHPLDIADAYYCERHDRFMARLDRFGDDLLAVRVLDPELVPLIVAVVGEIGDNSFAHNLGSWPDVPGAFFAYDVGKRLVVLADRGQGVQATLKRVRPALDNDRDALRVAFTEYVSGRAPEKRGNGLKLVRTVMEENQIGMTFQSGSAAVHIPKRPGRMTIRVVTENFRGTFARIDF